MCILRCHPPLSSINEPHQDGSRYQLSGAAHDALNRILDSIVVYNTLTEIAVEIRNASVWCSAQSKTKSRINLLVELANKAKYSIDLFQINSIVSVTIKIAGN